VNRDGTEEVMVVVVAAVEDTLFHPVVRRNGCTSRLAVCWTNATVPWSSEGKMGNMSTQLQ
jgi:hypothetical protein